MVRGAVFLFGDGVQLFRGGSWCPVWATLPALCIYAFCRRSVVCCWVCCLRGRRSAVGSISACSHAVGGRRSVDVPSVSGADSRFRRRCPCMELSGAFRREKKSRSPVRSSSSESHVGKCLLLPIARVMRGVTGKIRKTPIARSEADRG